MTSHRPWSKLISTIVLSPVSMKANDVESIKSKESKQNLKLLSRTCLSREDLGDWDVASAWFREFRDRLCERLRRLYEPARELGLPGLTSKFWLDRRTLSSANGISACLASLAFFSASMAWALSTPAITSWAASSADSNAWFPRLVARMRRTMSSRYLIPG